MLGIIGGTGRIPANTQKVGYGAPSTDMASPQWNLWATVTGQVVTVSSSSQSERNLAAKTYWYASCEGTKTCLSTEPEPPTPVARNLF